MMLQKNNYGDITSSREKIAEFVEGNCHYTIGGIEGFFNTITMVDIDVNV